MICLCDYGDWIIATWSSFVRIKIFCVISDLEFFFFQRCTVKIKFITDNTVHSWVKFYVCKFSFRSAKTRLWRTNLFVTKIAALLSLSSFLKLFSFTFNRPFVLVVKLKTIFEDFSIRTYKLKLVSSLSFEMGK